MNHSFTPAIGSRKMKIATLALSALMIFGTAAAQPPSASDAPFNEAANVFQRAAAGEKKDVEPAIAAFEALARAEPRNPVYAAYLGSALSLKGRDAWMPWNKLKYTEQGLDHIDRALDALKPEHDKLLLRGVPASIETRLVAARTFIKLPDGIFHRRAAGKKLIADLSRHPALAPSPAPLRAAVPLAAEEAGQ